MKHLTCPHCGSSRIGANRVPKDVVVVLPCPVCHELVVIYRNKAAAANREILENGTKEQRKAHIAEIVMEFLDSLVFRSFPFDGARGGKDRDEHEEVEAEMEETMGDLASHLMQPHASISQQEIDRFVKVDLQRIDDPDYFRRHFS